MAKIYGNRWMVKKSLNEGGQSVVFIVEDRTDKLPGEYALKRLKRKDRVARFRNEVAILRRMDDRNIIKLVDAQVQEDGSDDDSFLVMPVAEHGDLDSRLALYKGQLESVVQVASQIAQALKHAHDNKVVHRDVKPGNILFPTIGHDVWMSDFGLSFDLTAEERHTPDGEVVGPRVFIAPELTEYGQHDVKPSADVYSLGQVIFYMRTGGRWVSGLNVHDQKYNQFFNRGRRHTLLRLLLGRMIAEPESRYADMAPVIAELEEIDNWEKNAAGSLLDEHGEQATGRIQQRITDALQQKADNEAVRQKERDLLNNVSESAAEWLAEAMEAQKVKLGAGGALAVEVYLRELRIHRQLILDTRNNTTLQEVERVSLVIRPMTDKGYRGHFLHLYVCFEINHTLPFEHPHYLGKPGNPMLAVLPVFESRWDAPNAPEITEGGYFFGDARKHGVRDVPISSAKPWHRQMTNPQYIEGSIAITRFAAADWPAARSTITEMLKEVYNRMLRFVEQGQ
jgi:tRNA A-37 threonylcarbamoyl transferase component Bud32